jgi:UDP-3-O-[3-hydroxymyristoyl] glucosamine N-acyltransferase
MRLSELAAAAPLDVWRDGEFRSVGLLLHDAEAMLVGFYDGRYLNALTQNPNITCVITSTELASQVPEDLALAISADPKAAFYAVHDYLHRRTEFYWKPFPSEISAGAAVHEAAYVAPTGVRIGPGTIVEPRAVVMERSLVGRDVVIRAGAVVGGEDIEPKYLSGKYTNVPHAGGVLIGDGVEIGGNAHVQRSVYGGFTVVGNDSKVCALVHIAHNARIGERCFVAPFVIVCGSTTVGDDVWIGPNATISSQLRVGDGAVVTLGSVVTKDVPPGARVTGNFAIDHERFLAFIRRIR